MLGSTRHSVWFVLAAAGILGACGGSSVIEPVDGGSGGTGGTGGSGGTGGTAGTGGTGGTGGAVTACGLGTVGEQPPPPAANPQQPVSGKVAFAISRLWLGDTDWNGTPSPSAYKQFGYNLDNLVSTEDSVDLCMPASGALPSRVYPDGNNGIDNSFGRNLLPLFTGLAPDLSSEVNGQIASGETTVLVDVAGLGQGPDFEGLYATNWHGAPLPMPPSFDGTDEWSPLSGTDSSLSCGYATGHTVVLATGSIEIPLALQGYRFVLKLDQAVVTMELSSDHRTITRGVIAGIIHTETLVEDFRQLAGYFDVGLCDPSVFDAIADQLRQASDILPDGSQNPAQICSGISAGLGFQGSLVTLGPPAPAPPPPPDPCP